MVTPCINYIKHFYCPTNAHNVKKNVELLKHSKIKETAQCFGLQGNHHQGATAST